MIPPREPEPRNRSLAEETWRKRRAEHETVWALRNAGVPGNEIARQVGISRATVYRHLGREVFPDPARRVDAGQSIADE